MNKKHVKPKMRTNYFINKRFQGQFVLYLLIPSVSCLFVYYIIINMIFMHLYKVGNDLGLSADDQYFVSLNNQLNLMTQAFYGLLTLMVIFCILYGIALSHKIAGPLFNLNRHFLSSAEKGELRKLSFRPDDFFQEIPEAYNAFRVAFEEKYGITSAEAKQKNNENPEVTAETEVKTESSGQ